MNVLRRTKQPGFTIVELLVVIVVIGILAAITVVSYSGIQARARDSVRASDVTSIQKVLELYHSDRGGYPLCGSANPYTSGGWTYGTVTACLTVALVPTYIPKLPTDPKNSGSYQYQYAVGFKKTGDTSFVQTNGDNYIIGYKKDTITSPVYAGWGAYDLTALVGSSN